VFANQPPVHRRIVLESILQPAVNSFSIANEITINVSTTDTSTLYVLMSRTHTTMPSAAVVIASGIALPGSITTYTFTGLDRGAMYYGWAVATTQGISSNVVASTPASIYILPTPILTSTHPDYTYNGPGIYIKSGGGNTVWGPSAISSARLPISMYIGTNRILHVNAKPENGIPDALVTAANEIVINGAVFIVGARRLRFVQFGDVVDVFEVTPKP
jgi:hypothetical protein